VRGRRITCSKRSGDRLDALRTAARPIPDSGELDRRGSDDAKPREQAKAGEKKGRARMGGVTGAGGLGFIQHASAVFSSVEEERKKRVRGATARGKRPRAACLRARRGPWGLLVPNLLLPRASCVPLNPRNAKESARVVLGRHVPSRA
jgi:hypothetical protein